MQVRVNKEPMASFSLSKLFLILISLQRGVHGQDAVQYHDYEGSNVFLACVLQCTVLEVYDKIEVWRSTKTLGSFSEASATKIAEKTDDTYDVTYFTDSSRYAISIDFVKAIVSVPISMINFNDEGRYWCVYKDLNGGTDFPTAYDKVDLTVSWAVIYNVQDTSETMSFSLPLALSDPETPNYDKIEIWTSSKTLDLFTPTEATKLAEGTEDEVTYFEDSTRYDLELNFDARPSAFLPISQLEYADDGRYWCVFKDVNGNTNSPDLFDGVDLYITRLGDVSLTNTLDTTSTTELTGNDDTPSSDVVSNHPVSFECKVEGANPAATIAWKVSGDSVTQGLGISITESTVANTNIHTVLSDTTSTLTFTPQLDFIDGIIAYDGAEVECERTQVIGDMSAISFSKQRLNVLVSPAQADMGFIYKGNAYMHDDTIDIGLGQTIGIEAFVTGSKDAAVITFYPSISPLSGEVDNPGTEVHTANGDDDRLFDTVRTYAFQAVSRNDGDWLTFSVSNNAVTLAGTTPPQARINFNYLGVPDSQMIYTDPVTSAAEGPYVNRQNDCNQKIRVIAARELTITCRSEDADPFAVITIYQGDGDDVSIGDTELARSSSILDVEANPDVLRDGAFYTTTLSYTFNNPQAADNGDIISCVSRNTIDGDVNEVISSACLVFVQSPSEIKIFDGPTDGDNDGSTGVDDELDDSVVVLNGNAFDFTAVAYAANPAVDPFVITLGGVAVADSIVQPSDIAVSPLNSELFDSKTRVVFPAGYITLEDNGQIVRVCDPLSDICDEFELNVVDPPDSVSFAVSNPFAEENSAPNTLIAPTQDIITVVEGGAYWFSCTAMNSRPPADVTVTVLPSQGISLIRSNDFLDPDPDLETSSTTLYDATKVVHIELVTNNVDGREICCTAENTATILNDYPIITCKTVRVIESSLITIGDGSKFYMGGEHIPVSNQEMATFVCLLRASSEDVAVQWMVDEQQVAEIMHSERYLTRSESPRVVDIESTFMFVPNLSSNEGDSLTCSSSEIGQSTTNYLRILVQPDMPMVTVDPNAQLNDSGLYLILGKEYAVTCTAEGAKPAADIEFEIDGNKQLDVSPATETTSNRNALLWDSSRTITIVGNWLKHDGKELRCIASNEASEKRPGTATDLSMVLPLRVLSSPLQVTMSFDQHNNDKAGEVTASGTTLLTLGTVVFYCKSLQGKPAGNLRWNFNGEDVLADAGSYNTTSNADGFTFDSVVSLSFEVGFDIIGKSLTCCSFNMVDEEEQALSQTTTFDVIVGPSTVVMYDEFQEYRQGDSVERTVEDIRGIYCKAVGARPAGTISWALDNTFLTLGEATDIVTNQGNPLLSDFGSKLEFAWTSEHDKRRLSCIAVTTANSGGLSIDVTMNVKDLNTVPMPTTNGSTATTLTEDLFQPELTTLSENTVTDSISSAASATATTDFSKMTPETDICGSRPCKNGGVCKESSSSTYVCLCAAEYTGVQCENIFISTDPCNTAVCYNQGTCFALSDVEFCCLCTPKYVGSDCTEPVNDNGLPPTVILTPESVTINLNSPATLTCKIDNVNTIVWKKDGRIVPEFIGEEVLSINSVTAKDQGRYTCYGEGTLPGEFVERNAYILIENVSLYLISGVRFPTFKFNSDLENIDSSSFAHTAGIIERYLEHELLNAGAFQSAPAVSVTSMELGSVVAGINLYFEDDLPSSSHDLTYTIQESFTRIAETSDGYLDATNVLVNNAGICESQQCNAAPYGYLSIPPTPVGHVTDPESVIIGITGDCPWYTLHAGRPLVSGECEGDFTSKPQFVTDSIICTCGRNLTADEQLQKLAELELSMANVQSVLDTAKSITEDSQNIGVIGIGSAVDIVVDAVALESTEQEVTGGVVGVTNNIMDVNPLVLQETSEIGTTNKLTEALEKQLQIVNVSEDNTYHNVAANIAADVRELPSDAFSNGVGIVSTGAASEALYDELIMLIDSAEMEDDFKPEADSLIFIPGSVFDALPKTDNESIRVTFAFYSTPVLFTSRSLLESNRNNEDFQRNINSRILSCTVGGKRISNLVEPIRLIFQQISSEYFFNANNSACVYWDYDADGGRGNWSTRGCRTIGEIENGRQECECDHLTNFAVLMDIYGQTTLTQVQALILQIISYLGCSMSLAGVGATFVTYIAHRKLRNKQHSRILVNMCFALILLYMTFIVMISLDTKRNSMDPEVDLIGCNILAGVLQFALLSSLAWMGAEGINMYYQFVKVVNNYVPDFMRKAFLAAWGLPLIVTIVTGAAAGDRYARTDYCFLQRDPLIYGALLPVGVIIFANFIIFVMVLKRINNLKSTKAGKHEAKFKELKRRLRRAFTVLTLMGLTWGLGYLSLIYIANGIVQIFFCFFNTMQGVAIFMLYCVRQPEVLRYWKTMSISTKGTGTYQSRSKPRSQEVRSNVLSTSSSDRKKAVPSTFKPDSVPWSTTEIRRIQDRNSSSDVH